MMNGKVKFAVTAALLGMSVSANAADIDLFTTPQALLTDNNPAVGGLSSSVIGGADILGTERDLFVDLLSNGGNPARTASIGVGFGVLDFSVDTLATGTGTVQWDGVDGTIALNPTGLGGVDLTSGGALSAFSVTTLFADAGFEFLVNAYTDATTWTSISFTASGTPVPDVTTLSFSGFTNAALCGAPPPPLPAGVNSITCGAGGPVDLTNLGALEFVIDPNGGSVAVDLTLSQVTTVPEPSVLGLMGAGLLAGGIAASRKSRRAKTKA